MQNPTLATSAILSIPLDPIPLYSFHPPSCPSLCLSHLSHFSHFSRWLPLSSSSILPESEPPPSPALVSSIRTAGEHLSLPGGLRSSGGLQIQTTLSANRPRNPPEHKKEKIAKRRDPGRGSLSDASPRRRRSNCGGRLWSRRRFMTLCTIRRSRLGSPPMCRSCRISAGDCFSGEVGLGLR